MSQPLAQVSSSNITDSPRPARGSEIENNGSVTKKINQLCKNIIDKYQKSPNLQAIINLLIVDEKSVIFNNHNKFVESILFQGLHMNSDSRTTIGNMFAELLSNNVISVMVIVKEIQEVTKNVSFRFCSDLQIRIADIILPMMILKPKYFNFANLINAYNSINLEHRVDYFIELLKKIVSAKEMKNCLAKNGGIVWIYSSWLDSEFHISILELMTIRQLNMNFTNGEFGIFFMAVILSEKMKFYRCNNFIFFIKHWITMNIDEKIIKLPLFTRALTIAIFILCSSYYHFSNDKFFHYVHMSLLVYFIQYKQHTVVEVIEREVQCLYGLQMMCTVFGHPDDMASTLFRKLFQSLTICKNSFLLWKDEKRNETRFDEDMETKTLTIESASSFFEMLEEDTSDPTPTLLTIH